MNTELSIIVTAGGSSTRYGSTNKLLEKINGKEVIIHSIEAFLPFEPKEIIVSASESLEPVLKKLTQHLDCIKIIHGGATRQESVFNALKKCSTNDLVVIHDAARPLVKPDDIKKCIEKAKETAAAILSVKATDTIKKVDASGKIIETPNRDFLWCVQTPQIFDYKLIFSAHEKLKGKSFSDDAGMLEALGCDVYVVEGSYSNIKITTKSDIITAQTLLNIS